MKTASPLSPTRSGDCRFPWVAPLQMPLRERNPSTEAVFPLQGPHYLEMSPAQWRLKLERELAVSAHVQNFFCFFLTCLTRPGYTPPLSSSRFSAFSSCGLCSGLLGPMGFDACVQCQRPLSDVEGSLFSTPIK